MDFLSGVPNGVLTGVPNGSQMASGSSVLNGVLNDVPNGVLECAS